MTKIASRGNGHVHAMTLGVVLLSALAAAGAGGDGTRQSPPGNGGAHARDPEPTLLWHVSGKGRGRPAVDGSIAYFLSRHHEVVAIEATTGEERWRNHTGEPGDTTLGSLVVRTADLVVAGDYNVIAFDGNSGAMRWRFEPDDGYGPGYYVGSAAGDLLFTGSPAGRLYAIDIRTGRARWSALVDGGGKSTVFQPVTDGEIVVAGYTIFTAPNVGGVVAIDAASGHIRWRTPFPPSPGGVSSTKSSGGPLLYDRFVLATGATGVIHAFDRRDGTLQWSLPGLDVPAPFGPVAQDYRPLASSGDRLFAGSVFGIVAAYDLRSRTELWRYGSLNEGSVNFRITSDDRSVYVPYIAGRLVALDVNDGSVRWRMADTDAGFEWPAVPSGERVYAAASEGGFFAFSR